MPIEQRGSYFWGLIKLQPKSVALGTVVDLGLGSEVRVQDEDVVVIIQSDTGGWEGLETKELLKGSKINEARLQAEGGLIDLLTGHKIFYQWAPSISKQVPASESSVL